MAYEGFAGVYDLFMDEVDYNEWARHIQDVWRRYHFEPKRVLDLGCGTGAITDRLYRKGYDMIGVDISEEMLAVAREKNSEILYLHQDMRSFELYGTVDAVVCMCDSINYLLQEDEIIKVFQLVNNYLNPGGYFLFDMNTQYKYEHILGDNTFADMREDACYIWENEYDPKEKFNTYYMNFFLQRSGGLYERFEECHVQKAYTIVQMKNYIQRAGLEYLGCFHAFSGEIPKADSQRVYFIAREKEKNR